MFFCTGEMGGRISDSGQSCSGADVSERSISLCSCGASHIRPTAFCSIVAGKCSILQHRCGRVQHSAASLQESATFCCSCGRMQQSAESLRENAASLPECTESGNCRMVSCGVTTVTSLGFQMIRLSVKSGKTLCFGNYCDV